jgi:hypothetical protein
MWLALMADGLWCWGADKKKTFPREKKNNFRWWLVVGGFPLMNRCRRRVLCVKMVEKLRNLFRSSPASTELKFPFAE